jgi:hypothetical protein
MRWTGADLTLQYTGKRTCRSHEDIRAFLRPRLRGTGCFEVGIQIPRCTHMLSAIALAARRRATRVSLHAPPRWCPPMFPTPISCVRWASSTSIIHPADDDILEAEITILDFPLETGGGGAQHGVESAHTYEDIPEVDSFSKAKVVNFLNRKGASKDQVAVAVCEIRNSEGHTQYRGTLEIDFQGDYGTRTVEGLGDTERDAELLTFMHAERCIDALGFQLYGLRGSQQRHAKAAAEKGRWAPGPGEPPKVASAVQLPPPLRCTKYAARGPSCGRGHEGSEAVFQPVGDAPAGFSPMPLTLASSSVLDKTSVHRVRQLVRSAGHRLEKLITASPLQDCKSEWIVQLKLPLESKFRDRVGIGRAPDRFTAVILACMHAECVIDAVGAELFPDSSEKQTQHAEEACRVGRWATLPGDEHPDRWTIESPAPLRYHPEAAQATAQADVTVGQLSARITNIVTTTFVDTEALKHLEAFLGGKPSLHFIVQKLGTTFRASVLLPGLRPARVAVGVADDAEDAKVACAMHALQILGALGVPVYADIAAQRTYALAMREKGGSAYMHGDGTPAPDEVVTPAAMKIASGLDKHGRIKVSHTRAQKFAEERELKSLMEGWGASDAASRHASKDASVIQREIDGARRVTPAALWSLTPDVESDGCILVHPTSRKSEARSVQHTLYSPRVIDPLARTRFVDFLERCGTPRSAAFVTHEVESVETHAVFRATALVPVPVEFGVREARGEAPSAKEAEIVCSMHAELILDTLGLPMYDHVVLQNRHAKAARSFGRFAPMAFDPQAPPTTPSPPYLRKDRSDSLRWLRYVQRSGNRTQVDVAQEEADSAALLDLMPIRQDEIEPLANIRLGKYLTRHGKSLTADVVTAQVGSGKTSVYRSRLVVPVPPQWKLQPIAIGVASRRAESVILCCMHAERLIDQLGICLFDDANAQAQHVRMATARGRNPPSPGSPTPDREPESFVAIPGLQHVEGGPLPPPPTVPTHASDLDDWNAYVAQCRSFSRLVRQREIEDDMRANVAPRSGWREVDRHLAEAEQAPLDPSAQSTARLLARRLGHRGSLRADVSQHRDGQHVLYVGTMERVGGMPVKARGAALRRHDAITRCFMHLLRVLSAIHPEATTPAAVGATDARLPWAPVAVLQFHATVQDLEPPTVSVSPGLNNARFEASCLQQLRGGGSLIGRGEGDSKDEAVALAVGKALASAASLPTFQDCCAFLREHGGTLPDPPRDLGDGGQSGRATWMKLQHEVSRLAGSEPATLQSPAFRQTLPDALTRWMHQYAVSPHADPVAVLSSFAAEASSALTSNRGAAMDVELSSNQFQGARRDANASDSLRTMRMRCSPSDIQSHLQGIMTECHCEHKPCVAVCGSEFEAALLSRMLALAGLSTHPLFSAALPEDAASDVRPPIICATTLDFDALGVTEVDDVLRRAGVVVLVNSDESYASIENRFADGGIVGSAVVAHIDVDVGSPTASATRRVVRSSTDPAGYRRNAGFTSSREATRTVCVSIDVGSGPLGLSVDPFRDHVVASPYIAWRVARLLGFVVEGDAVPEPEARDGASCRLASALLRGTPLPAAVASARTAEVAEWLSAPTPARRAVAAAICRRASAQADIGDLLASGRGVVAVPSVEDRCAVCDCNTGALLTHQRELALQVTSFLERLEDLA